MRRPEARVAKFPRLAAARPRFEVAWRPKRRPPRTKHPKFTHFHRNGLRCGQFPGVWVARAHCRVPGQGGSDPTATLCVRTLTPECARQPLDMHVGGAAHTHIIGPTCESSGPRASRRAHVRIGGTRMRLSRVVRAGFVAVGVIMRGSETVRQWWQLGPTTGSRNPLMRS